MVLFNNVELEDKALCLTVVPAVRQLTLASCVTTEERGGVVLVLQLDPVLRVNQSTYWPSNTKDLEHIHCNYCMLWYYKQSP